MAPAMTGRSERATPAEWVPPGHARLRPSQRTLLLMCAGLAAGAVLVVTSWASLRSTHSAATDLSTRLVPARTALDDAQLAASKAQDAFITAAATNDPTERATAITEAEAQGSARADAYKKYVAAALNSPPERALQRQDEASIARSQGLGAVVIGKSPADPTRASVLADEVRESDRDLGLLNQIESRFYARATSQHASDVASGIGSATSSVLLAAGIVSLVYLVVALVLLRSARRDEQLLRSEAAAMALAAEQAEFETSLQRGLEMESTEDNAYPVLSQALAAVAPHTSIELLLADSSQAHFRQVLETVTESDDGCPVGAPNECPVTRSGQGRLFPDSGQLDTCPFLRRLDRRVWAACVPVSIAGRTTGVIHAQADVNAPRPDALLDALELVGRKAGERIGVLRVLTSTEAQARVDPLTGLPNRRTLENRAHDLVVRDEQFVVVYADLDHFKKINDTHGHETGDRALRLFARVFRDSVRPSDLPARHGGEEFVALLPDCTLDDAKLVAERVRVTLAAALERAAVPNFTVSIGLAATDPGESFSEVLDRADAAMLAAKAAGRNRIVLADDHPELLDTAGPDDGRHNGAQAPTTSRRQ